MKTCILVAVPPQMVYPKVAFLLSNELQDNPARVSFPSLSSQRPLVSFLQGVTVLYCFEIFMFFFFFILLEYSCFRASQVAQMVKNPPAIHETVAGFLG